MQPVEDEGEVVDAAVQMEVELLLRRMAMLQYEDRYSSVPLTVRQQGMSTRQWINATNQARLAAGATVDELIVIEQDIFLEYRSDCYRPEPVYQHLQPLCGQC